MDWQEAAERRHPVDINGIAPPPLKIKHVPVRKRDQNLQIKAGFSLTSEENRCFLITRMFLTTEGF